MGESGVTLQNWSDCLVFGEFGEEMARKRISHFITPLLKHFGYGDSAEDTQKQRSGIDFSLNLKELAFDVKVRDFKYYYDNNANLDIVLETVSVAEKGVPGWLYSSKSDVIFYAWANSDRTDLFDAVILVLDPIRIFISDYMKTQNSKTHRIRTRCSETYNRATQSHYHTEFLLVPIELFPSNALLYCGIRGLKETYYIDNTQHL